MSPEVNEYMDLKNSYMRIKFRIMNKDGTQCRVDDHVAPINDIFNGLWKNVELFLNDRLVSQSNNCHGYITMLKTAVQDRRVSNIPKDQPVVFQRYSWQIKLD